jgi:hypothetical protein
MTTFQKPLSQYKQDEHLSPTLLRFHRKLPAREWAQIDIEENERTAAEAFSRATTARTILGGAK